MHKPPIRKPQSLDIKKAVQQAVSFQQQGKLKDAESLCNAVLKLRPKHFDALHLLGVLRAQQRDFQAAVRLISSALKQRPDSAEAHSNLGITLANLGRGDEAIASFDRALALKPDDHAALFNRGMALVKLSRYEEAAATLARVVALAPGSPEVFFQLGNALEALNRHEEAVANYEKLLAIKPEHVKALNNKGLALSKVGRYKEAIADYEKALAIQPEFADAAYNRGNSLLQLSRADEAIRSHDQALAIKPDHFQALNSRGVALHMLGRFEDAIGSYNQALALFPGYADAQSNRGNSLARLGRYREAISSYEKALEADSQYRYAIGNVAINRMHICDWENYDANLSSVSQEVTAGKVVANPFAYLAMSDNAAHQLACAAARVRERFATSPHERRLHLRYQHRKIRIAYLSADFHDHATAYLMAELFETHDRSKFEIIGISFGPDSRHEMRSRLIKGFDRFADVRGRSDDEIARLLLKSEADIAVDLKGFTRDARTGIFALGAAPIQVNYLGYPGTMAAPFIDYIIADEFVIPRQHEDHYTEKVVYLPDCYQVNDSKRTISERTPTRAEVGLPEQGFVFCCFNNSYKITPYIFDIWARLLQSVDGSVLWLYQRNADTIDNLRREAQARGVDPHRLIFASKIPLEDHLARQRLADVFLDTLPYNAHTTASDALWAGLPVVTCTGTTFAGRVAGSLLYAIGLPELVTSTLEEYEALARKLATEKVLLKGIKEKLARNRDSMPLFDTSRLRRHIEAAYTTMWEIHQRGEKPRSFAVSRLD